MNQKEFEEHLERWLRKVNSCVRDQAEAFAGIDKLMHEIPQWGDESVVPAGSDLLHLYHNHTVFWLHALSITKSARVFVLTGAKAKGERGWVYVTLPTSVVETGLAEYFKYRRATAQVEEGKPMNKIKLGFKKLDPNAQLPKYAHEGDAGMDVFALNDVRLVNGVPTLVKTGLAAEIPDGYEIQVRSRSGLALKGVSVENAPGTIDSKYRGEIGVILTFRNDTLHATVDGTPPERQLWYNIKRGDKIAQLVLAPVTFADPYEVQELSETDRGTGGFGSTGR